MTAAALVRDADEAERRWFYGGGLHSWLVHEHEAGGDFLLFEATVEAGKVTPQHTHPGADETFYLLDGSIVLNLDGTEHEVRTGGVAVIPRGVPHAFMAQADGARMLCLHTPGEGEEEFYRCTSEPAIAGEPPLPVDFDKIRQGAVSTGTMRVVGPPPF
jgi:quercetin dioxygenase-like cupin family protein